MMDNTLDNTLAGRLLGQARRQGANGEEDKPPRSDLREVLGDLGNRLLREHGFPPAHLQGCSAYVNRTTEPLVRFLIWLQHTPEAGAILCDMGVWQENFESAEIALNIAEQLSPAAARSRWPRRRADSAGQQLS